MIKYSELETVLEGCHSRQLSDIWLWRGDQRHQL